MGDPGLMTFICIFAFLLFGSSQLPAMVTAATGGRFWWVAFGVLKSDGR